MFTVSLHNLEDSGSNFDRETSQTEMIFSRFTRSLQ